ncbi:hypothetical protein ACFVX6_33430 [Streptomyces sp. NPDC058289]|uniref:hypothetical protein n=1 Tax=Streptomyces sp. NPDC058289 TaxID=3346425 RepID=UPI0036E29C87
MTTGAILPERAQGTAPVLRQQVLVPYSAISALDSHVVGWSPYDGTGRTSPTTGDSDEPPYESGVAALRARRRVIQAAQLIPPHPGHEYDVSFLKHEFFERIVDARAEPRERSRGRRSR